MMKAHPQKFQATAPSSKHLGLTKAKKPPLALFAVVAASAAAAAAATATEEDTTGSQPQPQDQDPVKPPAQKKSRKKASSSTEAEAPPYHLMSIPNALSTILLAQDSL